MGAGTGNPDHFLNFGLGAIPGGAAGKAWTGENVFNTGNLKLDLLHNFFLESGARMGKIRVYESTQNPVAREMIGYLIVRGGVHQEAYAKALSDLSGGVDVTKLLPVPEIDSDKFPDARKYMDKGFHRILYRFSPEDYKQLGDMERLSAIDGPTAKWRRYPMAACSRLNPSLPLRPDRERRESRSARDCRTSRPMPEQRTGGAGLHVQATLPKG